MLYKYTLHDPTMRPAYQGAPCNRSPSLRLVRLLLITEVKGLMRCLNRGKRSGPGGTDVRPGPSETGIRRHKSSLPRFNPNSADASLHPSQVQSTSESVVHVLIS